MKQSTNYQADGFNIVYRNKGADAGDNAENVEETIYLISGSVEFTLDDEVVTVAAPAKLHIPDRTYHKLHALEDIAFVLFTQEENQ